MERIAKMRHRVEVFSVSQDAPDGIGGHTTIRKSLGMFWARVEQQSAPREEQGGAAEYKKHVVISIRSGAVMLTVKHLIVYDGNEYTITDITKDETKRITTVTAWARVK